MFVGQQIVAQPFTLDKDLKPTKLTLLENPNTSNGSLGLVSAQIIHEKDQYFYVEGHTMFQFIDVYVMSNYGDPNFKVDLVNTNWGDIVFSDETGKAVDGIVHFKLRAQEKFGIHVHPSKEPVNYSIVITASEPSKTYLGSAFKKATKYDLGEDQSDTVNVSNTSDSNSNSNMILYIIIGIALLVIGFLAAKVSAKNKKIGLIIIILMSSSLSLLAQATAPWNLPSDMSIEEYGEYVETTRNDGPNSRWEDFDQLRKGLDRFNKLNDQVGKALGTFKASRDYYDSYTGLSDCMRSGPPPGMPRIPSFCETDDCKDCFRDARQRFNKNRYTFEQLQTIYNCTKDFTDKAIAFGDNVSGYHGVSGLAWQSQKGGIYKSIKELNDAYDSKRKELLESQLEILMALNNCEAEHGLEDWYDRFGYLYFEFTQMHYKR